MNRAVLLRHGQTEANLRWLYCGSTDLPLSPEGREGLAELRRSMRYPSGEGLRRCTSGMLRTAETLELLYGPGESETLPAFREMDFGAFEMRSYEEMKTEPEYQAWITGDNRVNVCPGGESGAGMEARVLAGWRELERGPDALLVTHGGPIAAIMAELFPEEEKNRYEWQPKNGCGYLLERAGETSPWRWKAIPEPGEGA
jgi:alpha-ribazole phosphatase